MLTANPFYNKPGQEGQFQHFQAIAAAVAPFPVVLYNIPGRTGVNLEPATVARLAHAADNIVGIKESSGNLPQITELLTLVPRSFRVYAGDDAMALGVLGVGGAGLVSVASNAIPRELTAPGACRDRERLGACPLAEPALLPAAAGQLPRAKPRAYQGPCSP